MSEDQWILLRQGYGGHGRWAQMEWWGALSGAGQRGTEDTKGSAVVQGAMAGQGGTENAEE